MNSATSLQQGIGLNQASGYIGTANAGDWWWWQTFPTMPANYCGRCGTYYGGVYHTCPFMQFPVTVVPCAGPHLSADDVKRLIHEVLDDHDKKAGDRLVAALEKIAAGVKTGGKK